MKTTILIIDDEHDFLNRCATAMQTAGYDCELCECAEDAYDKFQQRPYDGIVCDLRIPFRGNRDGGLILAQQFCLKHPTAGMVLVSGFLRANQVNPLAGVRGYAFVEKGESAIEDILRQLGRVVRSKLVFVCMPFAQEFEDFYEAAIKPVILECGLKCERADELEHNRDILKVVYDQIKSAHIVVADMTGRNPNVYYEVGYAHALGKDVVLLIQRADGLPSDLRGFNHIVYEGRITVLKEKLTQRLKAMLSDGFGKNTALVPPNKTHAPQTLV